MVRGFCLSEELKDSEADFSAARLFRHDPARAAFVPAPDYPLPLDLLVIGRDQFEPVHERRITSEDTYYQAISTGWGQALKQAFNSLPDYTLT